MPHSSATCLGLVQNCRSKHHRDKMTSETTCRHLIGRPKRLHRTGRRSSHWLVFRSAMYHVGISTCICMYTYRIYTPHSNMYGLTQTRTKCKRTASNRQRYRGRHNYMYNSNERRTPKRLDNTRLVHNREAYIQTYIQVQHNGQTKNRTNRRTYSTQRQRDKRQIKHQIGSYQIET